MKIEKATARGYSESLSNDFENVPMLLFELDTLEDVTAENILKIVNSFTLSYKSFAFLKSTGNVFMFKEVDGLGNIGYLTVDYRGAK
jgi:hypothetical protein